MHATPYIQLISRLNPVNLQETKAVFEKLHKFLGKNIKHLVDRSDEPHVFRLHKNRVYYVRESLLRRATNVRHQIAINPVSTKLL